MNQEYLMSRLFYDPFSGAFWWKGSGSKKIKNGTIAFNPMETKKVRYASIQIDRKRYLVHRLAWLYFYGCWPKNVIDHKDGNPFNNSIGNLSDVTITENNNNKKRHREGKLWGASLLKGQRRTGKRWQSSFKLNGKNYYNGCFSTEQEAHDKSKIKLKEILYDR